MRVSILTRRETESQMTYKAFFSSLMWFIPAHAAVQSAAAFCWVCSLAQLCGRGGNDSILPVFPVVVVSGKTSGVFLRSLPGNLTVAATAMAERRAFAQKISR